MQPDTPQGKCPQALSLRLGIRQSGCQGSLTWCMLNIAILAGSNHILVAGADRIGEDGLHVGAYGVDGGSTCSEQGQRGS
jgi:hypothetical protein